MSVICMKFMPNAALVAALVIIALLCFLLFPQNAAQ